MPDDLITSVSGAFINGVTRLDENTFNNFFVPRYRNGFTPGLDLSSGYLRGTASVFIDGRQGVISFPDSSTTVEFEEPSLAEVDALYYVVWDGNGFWIMKRTTTASYVLNANMNLYKYYEDETYFGVNTIPNAVPLAYRIHGDSYIYDLRRPSYPFATPKTIEVTGVNAFKVYGGQNYFYELPSGSSASSVLIYPQIFHSDKVETIVRVVNGKSSAITVNLQTGINTGTNPTTAIYNTNTASTQFPLDAGKEAVVRIRQVDLKTTSSTVSSIFGYYYADFYGPYSIS